MKENDPLTAEMSKLRVPPPKPAAREHALHGARMALRQSPAFEAAVSSQGKGRSFVLNRGITGLLTALAALIVAVVVWRPERSGQIEALDARSTEIDRTVLGQIEALFGPRLKAVVEGPRAVPDVLLSDDAQGDAGLLQPVLIEFRRAGETVRVLGYSGRAVCIQLSGRQTRFEPLATGDGEVILSGEGFCWTPRDRELSGYRVAATLLSKS